MSFIQLFFPQGEPETLTGDGACSLTRSSTYLSALLNLDMTLADATQLGHYKEITCVGALTTADITLSLDSFSSISLAIGGWVGLFWDDENEWWVIFRGVGYTKNV